MTPVASWPDVVETRPITEFSERAKQELLGVTREARLIARPSPTSTNTSSGPADDLVAVIRALQGYLQNLEIASSVQVPDRPPTSRFSARLPAARPQSESVSVSGPDNLDWDLMASPPLPRRSGHLMVHLVYKGRAKPIPAEDPWA